ncbi:hypothetical protein U9M48_002059 [Paspalum notatum var. saurae]|uniref:Cytochrome P450 n=1 Tax=Paspalum notatum var. saurae TaxID=547442 RepID=A0AAQ3PFJ9_PASNO
MEYVQGAGGALACGLATLVLGWLLHFIYKWRNPPCNGRLPPGSFGLPVAGETFQFLRSSPSLDIADFYKLRLKRYGPLFKTSLLGKPMVVSMDMEVNHLVLGHEEKLFKSLYPDTMKNVFGKKTLENLGSVHKYLRSLGVPFFAPKNLKEAFISEMEKTITESLRVWATNPSIEIKQSVKNMMFDLVIKKLVGLEPKSPRFMELRKNVDLFFRGMISFPLYVPGTRYHTEVKGRVLW